MTTATAHHLRLTVRIHAGAFHKEADVALPLSSSVGELLAEITDLVDAPTISEPWRASTASGRAIDLTAPLAATALTEGSILVISPRERRPAPVIRDAAESLAAAAEEDTTAALPTIWAWAGLLAAFALVWVSTLPLAAWAALSAEALLLALWTRALSLVHLSLVAGMACGWVVISPSLGEAPFAALTACVALLIVLLACHVTGLSTVRTTAVALTVSVLLLVAALGYLLPGPGTGLQGSHGTAAAACVVIAGIILLSAAPALTVATAGLKVPQLPTAGQDLAVSDTVQPDVDIRARRAGSAYEGMCCGLALCLIPALIALSLTGSGPALAPTSGAPDSLAEYVAVLFGAEHTGAGFVQALCVTTAGAVVMHAARHGRALASWALMLLAMTACLATCLCATHAVANSGIADAWAPILVACLVLLAMLSAPLWAPKVDGLEPTTIAWFERIESLAIAASLPLAAHLAGVFVLIRGLG